MRPLAAPDSSARSPGLAVYFGGAACALIASGFGLFLAVRAPGELAAEYETATVTRGRITARVTATGTLSPRVTVQIGSQVSGRVLEVGADFNQRVRKGEVIARIDPRIFQTEVSRARANLEVAAAAVKRAEAEFDVARQSHERTVALAARQLVSQAQIEADVADYRSAESQWVSARAAHGQARSALEQAEVQLAYTAIASPIDGVVISRMVEVGQTVAASFQAPQLFTIAEDLRKMELHASVAEADVGRIEPGMTAEFGVDAYPTDTFTGRVKEVRYAPQNVQSVVTYDAVIAVENADLRLRPGMTASVRLSAEERPDALRIPNAALRFRPPGAPELASPAGDAGAPSDAQPPRRVAWVLGAEHQPQPVELRVGISDGRYSELLEGPLAEGDAVLVGLAAGADGAPQRAPRRRAPGPF